MTQTDSDETDFSQASIEGLSCCNPKFNDNGNAHLSNCEDDDSESFSKNQSTTSVDTSYDFWVGLSPSFVSQPPKYKVWSVGERCLAPFSEDERYYDAEIKSIFRDETPMHVKVKYMGYDSDQNEMLPVTALRVKRCRGIEEKKPSIREIIKNDFTKTDESMMKEKDDYMRMKYDDSVDDRPEKQCFENESKKQKYKESDQIVIKKRENAEETEKINSEIMKDELTPNVQRSKSKATTEGFSDGDLEKPHLQIEPTCAKVSHSLQVNSETALQIPASINQYLRDYQREGVEFMSKHLLNKKGCILGDDMGLGKTVQVISLMSAIMGKTGCKDDIIPSSYKKEQIKENKEVIPFLIVSPSSVLYNWEDELDTWGYFKIGRFHGVNKMEVLEKAKRGKLEIVLTTYETFRNYVDSINEVNWMCVILDEAHRIKEPNSLVTKAAKKVKCHSRIGLTGTPMQNNMVELWCLLDWTNPGCLGSSDSFKERFSTPIKLGQKFNATKRELATARKKQREFALLRNKWILRRTKDQLLVQLPQKDEKCVFVPLSKLQIALYKTVLEFPQVNYIITNGESCNCGSNKSRVKCCFKLSSEKRQELKKTTLQYVTLLRKIANHAALLLPYHKASETQKTLAMVICRQLFPKFPVLKKLYDGGSFAEISDSSFCGKMKVLNQLLIAMREAKDKVLIFSMSVQLLNILEAFVISKGYVYRRIDGETKAETRVTLVREFNQSCDVFLCIVSTTAGGLGLNFTGANRVIIFDPAWNPSQDIQAQDRAYRIGQRRNVKIYRLIALGTIEENMYLRQVYKQQLSNIAVQTTNERRLFDAVAGSRSMPGELFGIENLFTLREDGCNLTKNIIKRTEKVEAGILVSKFDIESSNLSPKNMSMTSGESRERKDDDDECNWQWIQEFDSDTEEDSQSTSNDLAQTAVEGKRLALSENEGRDGFTRLLDHEIGGKRSLEPCLLEQTLSKAKKRRKTRGDRNKEMRRTRNVIKQAASCEPSASQAVDDVLRNCGVSYVSTAKEVITRSAAEEKMTSKAIKDVYWHGLNSQQPAYCMDNTTSEESDDIPSSTIPKETADQTTPTKTSNTEVLRSKRVFERVGNDMFLVGQVPTGIREQQFHEIASACGFSTSIDFAKKVIKWPEDKLITTLKDFYVNKEPSITKVSAFSSIFSPCCGQARTFSSSEKKYETKSTRKSSIGTSSRNKTKRMRSELSSLPGRPRFTKLKKARKKIKFEFQSASSSEENFSIGENCDEAIRLEIGSLGCGTAKDKQEDTVLISNANDLEVVQETQLSDDGLAIHEINTANSISECQFLTDKSASMKVCGIRRTEDRPSSSLLKESTNFIDYMLANSPTDELANSSTPLFVSACISSERRLQSPNCTDYSSCNEVLPHNESFSVLDELLNENNKVSPRSKHEEDMTFMSTNEDFSEEETHESQNDISVLDELMG